MWLIDVCVCKRKPFNTLLKFSGVPPGLEDLN